MMFQSGTAFALELIALGIGFWVLLKAKSENAVNLKGFGTFIGYFIIVATFLAMLCTAYYTVRYWEDGYFTKSDTGKMVMMQRMHNMQGCDRDMMTGKMGMHSDQCSKMMGSGDSDMKCKKMMKGNMKGMMKGGMMEGKMGAMMEGKSDMEANGDHAEHHPENNNK